MWGVIVARDTSSSLMFFQISCPSPCSICFTRHEKGLRHRLFFCPLGKSQLSPFVQFMHLLFRVLSLGWTSTLVVPSFLSPSSMLAFSFTKFGRVSSFRGLTRESEGTKMGTGCYPRRYLLTYIEHNASKQVLVAGNSSGAAKGALVQALKTSLSTQHCFITSLLRLVQQVHNKSM